MLWGGGKVGARHPWKGGCGHPSQRSAAAPCVWRWPCSPAGSCLGSLLALVMLTGLCLGCVCSAERHSPAGLSSLTLLRPDTPTLGHPLILPYLSVFQRPPENRGDFGWAPEEDPEQRPVHASTDESVSDLDGMTPLVQRGGGREGMQRGAEVGGEELTGAAGQHLERCRRCLGTATAGGGCSWDSSLTGDFRSSPTEAHLPLSWWGTAYKYI